MIIVDCDFLSAFLKINKLPLIFTALEIEELVITEAVLQEIKQAPIYDHFLKASREHKIMVKKIEKTEIIGLGRGELESIALAQETNSVLLMDDRKAARFAEFRGLTVMSIPVFLLHCKRSNILSIEEIQKIMRDLKEKDYYQFNPEIEKKLAE